MDRPRVAGVDVGGSGVRAGAHPGGSIASESLAARDVPSVIAAVERVVRATGDVDAVGVAVPGFLVGDVVRASPNFPAWRDVPIAALLSDRLGVPVAVENDATAAALGAWSGRGGTEDLVLLTLGTGVGGGVVLGGRALRGRTGSAGELGHIYAGGDQLCGCGARGCLETWASTSGWIRRLADRGIDVADGRAVIAAAEADVGWAVEVLDDAGRALGRAARTLANTLDPDVILLAGGLTAARRWLEPGLLEGLSVAAAPIAERIAVDWLGHADRLAIAGAGEAALSLLDRCGELPT